MFIYAAGTVSNIARLYSVIHKSEVHIYIFVKIHHFSALIKSFTFKATVI